MIPGARDLAAALEATPYASRLGLSTGDILGDAASASVPYEPSLANAQGFVHGGVAASLALWAATIVTAASDRERVVQVRPVSIAISYLSAAREESLHAAARVSSRGRDLVHVEVEVASDSGRAVALALIVLRTLPGREPVRDGKVFPAESTTPQDELRLLSPFNRAMGVELRPGGSGPDATLAMRRDVNAGLTGAVDAGALLALADTCAALACLPNLDERRSGSATLSLSAVFGADLFSPVLAVGRRVTEDGGVRSAAIEIRADGPVRSARMPAMTSCVSYRFRSAEVPRGGV